MAKLYYQTPEGKEFLERNAPVQTKVEKNFFSPNEFYSWPLPPGDYTKFEKRLRDREEGRGVAYPEWALRGSEIRKRIDPNMRVPIPEDGSGEGGILARFPNDGNFISWLEKDEFKFHPRVQKALSDIMAIDEIIKKYHKIAYSEGVGTIKNQERDDALKIVTDLGNEYQNLINIYKRQFNWDTYT